MARALFVRLLSHPVLLRNAAAALAMVVAAAYGLFVARHGLPVATVWPASAVAFSAIFLGGTALVPGVVLGRLASSMFDGRPLWHTPILLIPLAAELIIALWLCGRLRLKLRFETAGEVLHLTWIALLSSGVGAWIGVELLRQLGSMARHSQGLGPWRDWMLGDAIGIFAFAPAMLLWLRPAGNGGAPRVSRTELTAMLTVLAMVCAFVLVSYRGPVDWRTLATVATTVPLFIWIGLRADLPKAAAMVVLISVAATVGAKLGTGALFSATAPREVANLQMFHVVGVLLVLIVAASVSERESALATLRESEARLALVFNGTPDIHSLYELDSSGTPRLLTVNQRWREAEARAHPGGGSAELIGKTPEEVGATLGLPAVEAALLTGVTNAAIQTGVPQHGEVVIASPAGPRFHERTVTPVADSRGRTRYLLETSRDVTSRRHTEQRLHESELRFAAVSDATHDVQLLFSIEADGQLRLVHINRVAREVFHRLWPADLIFEPEGLTFEEALQRARFFTPEMVDRELRAMRACVADKRSQTYVEEVRTPLGYRVAEVSHHAILGAHGAVTHILRTSSDITARHVAEERARQFSEHLEHRVAERTAQLEAANRELEAFTYSVSHDLRAPLRGMEGFTRALIEDYSDQLPAGALSFALRAHAASTRLKQLLDDLLRLSKLTIDDIARIEVDVSAIATSVLQDFAASEPTRDVSFLVHPEVRVSGDARLAALALENLLSNAWKYTSRRAAAVIEVGGTHAQGADGLFVRDNGVGFDPQFAEHLFAPFARLHKTGEFEGAGIGLATVHRIATVHGGRVWAESRPNDGATFFLTFGPSKDGDE